MFRRLDPVLLCMLAVSLGSSAYLYRLNAAVRHSQAPAIAPLKAGDRVPGITGAAPDGSGVTAPSRARVVLYFFSPSCSWCERNIDNAKAIAAAAGPSYTFVAVSTVNTGVREYIRERKLGWTVVDHVPVATLAAYKIIGTPQTTLVSPDGVVLASWSGAYTESSRNEIGRLLNVTLPGLVEPKQLQH